MFFERLHYFEEIIFEIVPYFKDIFFERLKPFETRLLAIYYIVTNFLGIACWLHFQTDLLKCPEDVGSKLLLNIWCEWCKNLYVLLPQYMKKPFIVSVRNSNVANATRFCKINEPTYRIQTYGAEEEIILIFVRVARHKRHSCASCCMDDVFTYLYL
jgi:hypothetical protein